MIATGPYTTIRRLILDHSIRRRCIQGNNPRLTTHQHPWNQMQVMDTTIRLTLTHHRTGHRHTKIDDEKSKIRLLLFSFFSHYIPFMEFL